MSGTGSDYAHAGIEILYRTHDVAGMPKKVKQAITNDMNERIAVLNRDIVKEAKKRAEKSGNEYQEPDLIPIFKGFDGQEKQIFDNSPIHRKVLMQSLDTKNISKLEGAPSAIDIRHAITDNRFRDLTRGDPDPLSGFDFIGFNKPKIIPSSHTTYSDHLTGNYLGGFKGPVPQSLLFPDFTKKMIQQNRPMQQWNYMIDRTKPSQLVDDQWVNRIGEYQKKITGN